MIVYSSLEPTPLTLSSTPSSSSFPYRTCRSFKLDGLKNWLLWVCLRSVRCELEFSAWTKMDGRLIYLDQHRCGLGCSPRRTLQTRQHFAGCYLDDFSNRALSRYRNQARRCYSMLTFSSTNIPAHPHRVSKAFDSQELVGFWRYLLIEKPDGCCLLYQRPWRETILRKWTWRRASSVLDHSWQKQCG